MELYGLIIVIQIVRVGSASNIFGQDDNEYLKTTAADIVNRCFASSERWSELLIVSDRTSSGILEQIHHESKITKSIVFLDDERNDDGLTHPGKCDDYYNTSFEWRETKTSATMITTHSVKHLENVLSYVKNNIRKLWRPRESLFLIVLDTGCDVAECNNMFKVMWDNWILNAVILCSSNKPGNRNLSGIELYSFNPYSADRSQQWATIIHETVEVSISTGNFNHSWYIFKQRFTEIRSSEDCGDIFFDKTSNLDGYVIPISVGDSTLFSGRTKTANDKWLTLTLGQTIQTVAKSLRFDFIEVLNNDTDALGQQGFINGSYTGVLNDIYKGRSHFSPVSIRLRRTPGLELTYPHDKVGACLASHNAGNQPQWSNFASARHILISLGVGLLFSAIVFYLQNKSHGIVSALLNAERLMIGSSIICSLTAIKHRAILGSMLLVVLVIDGAIRGRFISILTVVRPYPNIETLEQLEERDMDIYAPEAFGYLITDPKLKARLHTDFVPQACIDSIELGDRHRVCLTICSHLACHTSNSAVLHKASTPVTAISVAFATALHWPMKDRYSFQMQKLVESDILRKWRSDAKREADVDGWKASRSSEPPFVSPTKFNDLLPAFLLLLMGLSIATIVFVWEVKAWKHLRCDEFPKLNSSSK